MSEHIDFRFPCGCFTVDVAPHGYEPAPDNASREIAERITKIIGKDKVAGEMKCRDPMEVIGGGVRFSQSIEASFMPDRNPRNGCSMEYKLRASGDSLTGFVDRNDDCFGCNIQNPGECPRIVVQAICRWRNDVARQR